MFTTPKNSSFSINLEDRTFSFIKPSNQDELLERAISNTNSDEFIPYWAELWPSTEIAISRIKKTINEGETIVELGSGLGVYATIASSMGHRVVATDYSLESCDYIRQNGEKNKTPISIIALDWRAPSIKESVDAVVVGIDILYESRWIPAVTTLLESITSKDRGAIIYDPCRKHLPDFIKSINDSPTLKLEKTEYFTTTAGKRIAELTIKGV